jgi:hypothetical protein
MEQQDFCKNPVKPDFRQGDRESEAESEMEMSEAKRERTREVRLERKGRRHK